MGWQWKTALVAASVACASSANAAYLTYTFGFAGAGERVTQSRTDGTIIRQGLQGATLTFGFNVEDGDLNAGGFDNYANFGLRRIGNALNYEFTSESGQSNVFASGSGSACLSDLSRGFPTSASAFTPGCGAVSYSYSTRSGFNDTFSGTLISVAVDRSDERGPSLLSIVSYVPEPATWALMLAGFGMMGYALRRRPRLSYAL